MSNWNQQYPPYPSGAPVPMPGGQGAYPPPQTGMYPGGQPAQGFPGYAPSYPPQQAGYPVQQGGYPPAVYQSQQAGYPPQQAGFQSFYSPQQQQSYPGFQPPQAAYPSQQQVPYQNSGYPQGQGQYPNPGVQPQGQQYSKSDPQMAQVTSDEPTLRPFAAFNAENDAKVLNKAMKGLGTDEKAIIEVLSNRSNGQRLQIVTMYKTLFGKDLIKHLKSELSGKLEDTVVALLQSPDVFDAYTLNDAISGIGTKEEALIEIILSRSNVELAAVKHAYKTIFKRDLEKDVMGDTSGYFKRILVACLQCNRQEDLNVDLNQAKADAKALYDAGPKKWGTDEATFIGIFALRSFAHLRVVFDEFKQISKKDIENVLKGEMSGNLEESFLALAKIARNKHAYFAERLYSSMKGAGTHDKRLIRIIITRCEKDLNNIRKEFVRMYGKTVESFISDDCSGDYKKILLALVNPGSR